MARLVLPSLTRLVMNTGLRMFYPFLPVFARELQVSPASLADLISLRGFMGFFSPLFGPLADLLGRRILMVGSMLLFTIGCFLVWLWPTYVTMGATLCLFGLAKVLFDPALQAYLGDSISYRRRGMAIAITEFAWSGGLLVGAPIVALVMNWQGWNWPFFWLGIFGAGFTLLLWWRLPPGKKTTHLAKYSDVRFALRQKTIWAAAAFGLLTVLANEILFIVFGTWMEESFQLPLTGLGLTAGLIGGSEFIAELTAGWSTDRFGKRPVIALAGILTVVCYAGVGFLSGSLAGALFALALLFFFFEWTIVAAIPLFTEIAPSFRATVLSIIVATSSLGRALGAIIGPRIYLLGGLRANAITAAILMAVAVVILGLWVREGE